MTEDEAKTKWCPFVRAVPLGEQQQYPINVETTRDMTPLSGKGNSSRNCIAPACMAWRWADEIERRWTGEPPEGEGWQRVEAIGGVAHYARTHKTPHGYCGLAGAPQ